MTRKAPGSTSNSAPSQTRPRLFREVTVPFPRPGRRLPAGPLYACVELLPGPLSNLPFHLGKSAPPCTAPSVQRWSSPSSNQFHPPPRGTSGPSFSLQWRENSRPRTRGRSPGGRWGGAQARSVPGWAPGRPGSCLLPQQARGSRRANGGQPRRRRPPRWPSLPVAPRQPRQSGSFGRLRLVGGRERVRAFAVPCSGSIPLSLTPKGASPNVSGSRRVTGAAALSSVVPTGLGGLARGKLRALSAGGTGSQCRGKLADLRWAPATGGRGGESRL